MAGLVFSDTLERAENIVADLQIAQLGEPPPAPLPVVVEVDEKSLRLWGQWPWPRYLVARLFARIAQAGAAAVGIDTIFAERDRTSPAEIAAALRRDFGAELALDPLPEGLRDYDRILAATLSSGPFVLSYYFAMGQEEIGDCRPNSAGGAELSSGSGTDLALHQAVAALCSIPVLRDVAAASGFTNGRPDADGLYRRTPLLMQWNGRLYPSLSLQTYLTAAAISQFVAEPALHGLNLRLGAVTVPLDPSGNLLIRFRNRSSDYLSAADVLAGRVGAERLRGKTVFVGFSATGLHEYRPTPFDPDYTGVQLHAAVADNLARGDFLLRPAWSRLAETLLAAVLGAALAIVMARAGPSASALFPALGLAAVAAASQFLLIRHRLVLSPVLPATTLLVVLLALSLLKFSREYRRGQQLTRQIADGQEAIIEGFCAMSEYRDPETGSHIRRTQNYVKALALRLRQHERFRPHLDDDTIALMYKTAPLHDIGKIGIRDHILLKPDRLTEEEFDIMKTHTVIGGEVVQAIGARMGSNRFLDTAADIILGHQEKWDGSGYPYQLCGDDIPVAARLMALADVYDALISRRVYKPPLPHDVAVEIIARGRGSHFDPDVVDAFLDIHEEFHAIAVRYQDQDDPVATLPGD